MLPRPETEKNLIVLLNKASLDLIRAVEREKLRRVFIKAVMKNTRKWEQILAELLKKWPRHQAAFYRN